MHKPEIARPLQSPKRGMDLRNNKADADLHVGF